MYSGWDNSPNPYSYTVSFESVQKWACEFAVSKKLHHQGLYSFSSAWTVTIYCGYQHFFLLWLYFMVIHIDLEESLRNPKNSHQPGGWEFGIVHPLSLSLFHPFLKLFWELGLQYNLFFSPSHYMVKRFFLMNCKTWSQASILFCMSSGLRILEVQHSHNFL